MIQDLIKAERSYRSFDSSYSVSCDTLYDFIENVRYTPSTMNAQGLRFRLCYQKEECGRLLALTKWAAALKDRHFPPVGHEPTAFIVICAEKEIFTRDVGIAAQTIMLSAVEKGLGGCMLGNYDADKVLAELGIPAEWKPRLILALGKPDETVVIEEMKDGNTAYYRDENNIHHVPKRKTSELIL